MMERSWNIFTDSEKIYGNALKKVVAKYGHDFNHDMQINCMGRKSISIAALLINMFKLPLTELEFVQQYEEEALKMLSNVPLMPGVDELLRHLYDQHIPMAIATSSSSESLRIKSYPHRNLLSVMHHVVCGDDPQLKRSKPAPDIFLLAASRFKPQPKPECCLVFEDSPAGMRAGLAAGMQVVMIPEPHVPKELREGATLVLPSMECFQPELFGLPYIDCSPKFSFG
ncbi:pseudouridine-5'-phosphatase-like isoform X2 [Drosophila sulfurigaster albostrigata]|uniref:pseudouridine-5'-phosphatase-like isoform X2 n=1 Tax=Drosophila sulfurigaster albostrigata TaxID=89887 RepID=UPI002D21C3A5|nr:pseudouridine-5'-phosphatase-like isoform X2 [Drosophila sulfurigaster albostrigata]